MSSQPETGLPGWRVDGTLEATLGDCTLIVPTYRRPNQISELLQTVNEMPHRPAEVVVVDASPESDTERTISEWIAHENLSFDLIYARCPKGLTRQRNAGIDLSSREYIFFLDDDCLPKGDYFEEIRRVFAEDRSCRIGAVSALIINEMYHPISLRWRVRLALRLVPRIDPGIYHASGTSVPANLIAPFAGLRFIDTLSGAMSVRRCVLNQHRFSEFFSGYAQGEDLEISLRIRRHWSIVWCGDARVEHYHAPSGRPTSFAKGTMEVRNRHFIWKRHTPVAKWSDRLRFWLDIMLLFVVDLGSFCRRPSQIYHLSHAAGLITGALTAIFAPSRYKEPPPRKQFYLQTGTAQ